MQRTLAERCRTFFTSRVVERGRAYFRSGRVTIEAIDDTAVEARVRGSARASYFVVLSWDDEWGAIAASCDCPFAEDFKPCKHMYATLLECDQGEDDLPFPDRELRLEVVVPDDFHPNDEAEEQDDGLDGFVGASVHYAKPAWRQLLDGLVATVEPHAPPLPQATRWRLEYHALFDRGQLEVHLYRRTVRKDGTLGVAQARPIHEVERASLDPADAEIIELLSGCSKLYEGGYGGLYGATGYYSRLAGFRLRPGLGPRLLPMLCSTGRFGTCERPAGAPRRGQCSQPLRPLSWDDGTPYRGRLVIEPGKRRGDLRLSAMLQRDGEEPLALDRARGVLEGGLVVLDDRIARATGLAGGAGWIAQLAREGCVEVPGRDKNAFMLALADSPSVPELVIDPAVGWEVQPWEPAPVLRFVEDPRRGDIGAQVWFDYGSERVRFGGPAALCSARDRRLVLRDPNKESAAVASLAGRGFVAPTPNLQLRHPGGIDVALPAEDFGRAVRELLDEGWVVEASGRRMRAMNRLSIQVSSGVDWFEVGVSTDLDESALELPELLAAIRKKEGFVTLGDGSRALLPEDWLARFGAVAELGRLNEERSALRVARNAGVLLDLMLAAQPEVDIDAGFAKFRKELARFDRVRPARAPRGFGGTLRGYQEQGLGWLKALARLGFGGCLADDMGLGKTVQVLALLAGSKPAPGAGPTLVVAPRSLVFNWLDEARRFTPRMRASAYLGPQRRQVCFDELDLVVTTYGTLRRDIESLRGRRFHYVVLDEASAIKNPDAQIAKACRLLQADHRLALTGTPVENRLSDLASILEFLNPGLLGSVSALEALSRPVTGEPELAALGPALRPFLLRRTKEQVLSELPDKTEQVLRCELGKKQRKLYDELRDHYRALLDKTIRKQGLARSKMHVLEALLRLRQAACHPGLLDPGRKEESSAKLDALMDTLLEVVEAGHKALVFSQFTSFLAIARERLERVGVSYAYLDGATRRRKREVERFQTEPDCRAFLISLKAGGHGLNLTAAEYVFLLDPWWNPAVEAQAIDRAHRIGQQRPVFAYRMIAENTVEERVLELQQRKRELAEGIFAGNRSLLGDLTADDLAVLLQ